MIKKIFFWDGNLNVMPPTVRHSIGKMQAENNTLFSEVNAGIGVSACNDALEWYKISPKNCFVLTNYLQALNCDLFDKKMYEGGYLIKELFYLWDARQEKWAPIEEFTDKELRYPHNLARIYLSGGFDKG